MGKGAKRYAPEFREQMIGLVRAGRKPHELSREFGVSAQAIRNWAAQDERDRGQRKDGLTVNGRPNLIRRWPRLDIEN